MRLRPALAPWLGRFVAASTPGRVRRAHNALRALALESAVLHAELAAGGLDTGFARRGLLNVYASEKASQVREHLPYIADPAAGALLYPEEAHCDPQLFVLAIAEQAKVGEARAGTGVEVLEIRRRGARVTELWTTRGVVRAGQFVLAAGAHSPRLVRDLGFPLPIKAERATHRGRRTRRGLPIIGRAPGVGSLFLATGHGIWGLQLAPVMGRIVTELACGIERRQLATGLAIPVHP